ncbi:hypothetical protein Tco_0658805 [Tanacetum coccineum]
MRTCSKRSRTRARTIVKVCTKAERTIGRALRAHTEGNGELSFYENMRIISRLNSNSIQLVQAKPPFHDMRGKSHAHINQVFKSITLDLRFRGRGKSVSKTDEIIDKLADQLSTLVKIVSKKVVTPTPVKAVEEICFTSSGPHAWYNCPNTDNNQSSVCAATGSYNQVNPPNRVSNQMAPPGFAPVQNNGQNSGILFKTIASTSGTLRVNTISYPKGEMKAITTRSGIAYEGPSIPTNPSPKKVVEQETEKTTDKEQTNFQGSTAHIPPPVNPIQFLEPKVSEDFT